MTSRFGILLSKQVNGTIQAADKKKKTQQHLIYNWTCRYWVLFVINCFPFVSVTKLHCVKMDRISQTLRTATNTSSAIMANACIGPARYGFTSTPRLTFATIVTRLDVNNRS